MDVVLVTYNSAPHLEVWRQRSHPFDRVVVVDNASADGTVAVAEAAGFDVVRATGNRGFAAAANLGAKRTRGPFFCVLNPDVHVRQCSDVEALKAHFSDPAVGAVAPGLRLPDGSRQDSARRVPTPFDLMIRRLSSAQPDAVRATQPLDVDWVVGAFIMFDRRAFDAVRGFDEGFFLYFEDVDICLRLRQAGFRVRYDPTCEALHEHQAASRRSLRSAATREHVKSALRFYRSNPDLILRASRRRRLMSQQRSGERTSF